MRNTQAAFIWIIDHLTKLDIPYQIAGGLAAKAYGATRELADIDIDIPQIDFHKIVDSVKEYITFGPDFYKDDHWDLYLMTLRYQDQEIDISAGDNVKMFNSITNQWQFYPTDFSHFQLIDIMGIKVPVIIRENLISYKKVARREVDLLDIQQLQDIKK